MSYQKGYAMKKYILALDQGTTSTRAMLFNQQGKSIAKAQKEFQQFFPENGWVEHDPEEIWRTVVQVCQDVILQINGEAESIAAIGITNQRETTIIWHKETGKAIYPAIVWQDRRTAEFCQQLKDEGLEEKITQKTGLLLDPYFSATKIHWILNHVPNAKQLAKENKLAFGTIDSFLLWRLTEGRVHATDITNASRTLLFNLHTQKWDEELLKLFDIPACILPEIKDNCADFGMTDKKWFSTEIPVSGMAGDQQAAAVGQACFKLGMIKSTYGTGCFMMVNTGEEILTSKNRLLTTVMFRIQGKTTYALEGSIFVAGAAVKWLRDKLNLIQNAAETETIAASISSTNGVYLIPAFTGLGAPYWQPDARGAIIGMTRDTGKAEIIRATLEAVCYQSKDLLEAIKADGMSKISQIRVDGGMVENNWLLQFLADILRIDVERPASIETTVRGAAYLAGLQVGFYSSLQSLETLWELQNKFSCKMTEELQQQCYAGWKDAVNSVL